MKIILDAQPIVEKRTGVGRYAFELIQALGKSNHNIEIIPFYFNFKRAFNDQSVWQGMPSIKPCEVRCVPGALMHQLWQRCSLFPLTSFAGEADIYHFPNYLMKPCGNRGKVILTVHDLAFKRFPETLMPKNLKNLNGNFEKSLNRSDAVICVSEFSKNEFQHFFPDYQKSVFVTYNGVDEFFGFEPDKSYGKQVLKKYQMEKPYLLYVGTIEPRKNLVVLLKAFSLLKKKFPDLELCLIGQKGWLCQDFFDALNASDVKDSVRLPGFVEGKDLPYVYHYSRMFVFPSLYEGFGIPPLEAMACRTPVLLSDIPVLREVAADCALYCRDYTSPEAWQEQMSLLLNDSLQRENLIQKGAERVKLFSWSETARKTLEAYSLVLG